MLAAAADGVIGRLWGRREMPAVYRDADDRLRDKSSLVGEDGDVVELSSRAPRPLSAAMVERAADFAGTLRGNAEASAGAIAEANQSAVFRALAALLALQPGEQDVAALSWPGGLPAPTPTEMEIAKRRLAQRLRVDENDPPGRPLEALNELRVSANDRLRAAKTPALTPTPATKAKAAADTG